MDLISYRAPVRKRHFVFANLLYNLIQTGHIMQKVCPEELAACFRFLAFRDVITASHVSRSWRAAALAFPDLWTRISLGEKFYNRSNLVHMAISRAGQLAVDFEHLAPGRFAEGMAQAISQHIHRFRSFKCSYSLEGVDICRPAPLLREFVYDGLLFHIPAGFLGGSTNMGSLLTLLLAEAVFPPLCPALDSVTHLRATLPESYHGDSDFRFIFELCPRLEILELKQLEGTPGIDLPASPAPRTLREVMLHTCLVCNLVELFSLWMLEAVPHVRLDMPIDADLNLNLAPFFAGASALSVTVEGEDWDAAVRMAAELPDARRRTVVCTKLDNVLEPRAALSYMLHAPQVQTLSIPLGLLSISAPLGRCPRLAHLSVLIYETKMFPWLPAESGEDRPRFSWPSLECLRALPPLETLALHVSTEVGSDPPAWDDARELKAGLSALRDCVPREVQVHGFPADVAGEILVSNNDQPRVVFH